LANHKSALKRARQSKVRRIRNLGYKTRAKHAVKDVRTAVEGASAEKAVESLREATASLQKAASKGVIHKKNAARRISRLSRQVNQVTSS
jgi:small subunit ribosomal protein S20